MSNLLPPSARQAVRRLYTAQQLFLGSSILLVAAVIALLSLAPSYLVLQLEEQRNADAPAPSAEEKTAKDDLIRSQKLLSELALLSTSTPFLDPMLAALSDRPSGVHIQQLRYAHGAKGTPSGLVLSGVSDGRERINAYRVILQADKSFKSVSVPVNALAGASEGQFTITLTPSN